MEEDPILQELRQARRELLREAGGDLANLIKRANREGPALWKKYRKIVAAKNERRRNTAAKSGTKAAGAFRSDKSKSRKI